MAGVLEFLRRVVRQQTNLVGQVVSNIYGAVPGTVAPLADTQPSSWLKVVLPGTTLKTLDEFYALWSIDTQRTHSIVPAIEGAVIATESSATLQLFRGLLTVKAPTTFTLTVDAGGPTSSAAIYVDGVLQRKANDAVELPISLAAGDHVIEVVMVAQHVVIGAPATLTISGDQETLQTPAFDSTTATWLDGVTGTPGTQLIWNVDPRVGGYRVLRKQVRFLGKIKAVSAADTSGIFGITMSGDQSAALTPGETVGALHEEMGTVLRVGLYDSGSDETSLTLRLVSGLSTTKTGATDGWVGRTCLAGHYDELKRIHRTVGAGQMTMFDADVKTGSSYEYGLQSYGLFDETKLSKVSDPAYVRAGDITPPGPITFVTGYPKVVNGRATIRYVTPADDDYDGTQVFFRQQYSGVVSSATAGAITFTTPILNGLTMGTDVYRVVLTSGPAQGAVKKITSFTSTVATLDANEQLSTLPVNGNTAVVFVDYPVVTDRGVASANDELSFDAKKYGDGPYFFRTFDFGNNLQLDADGVVWNYNHVTDDSVTGGVVLPTIVPVTGSNAIASENGTTGTVTFSFYDPQSRATQYRITTTSGRAAPVVGTLTAAATTMSGGVTLISKIASYIDVDWYGVDGNGVAGQLLGHQRFTFGLGSRPIQPLIGWSVDALGNLSVSVSIDNDTHSVRYKAQKRAPISDLDTNGTLDGSIPVGTQVRSFDNVLTGLTNGERFYISARAYNTTDGTSPTAGSDISNVSDVYAGVGSSYTPQITATLLGATSAGISVQITPNLHCAEFEIYVKEYSADPGSFSAIDASYPTPYDDVVVGDVASGARVAPNSNLPYFFPIGAGGNYIVVTLVPYDSLAKVGTSYTQKYAGGGSTTGPAAPTASANVSVTAESVTNSVTIPSPVPNFIRQYRDGVNIGDVAVPGGTTVGTVFTLPADTGRTPSTPYGYQYSSVVGGVESLNRTTVLQVVTSAAGGGGGGGNGTIPAPTLTDVSYQSTSFYFTITPAVGTPTGVTWHVERSTTQLGAYNDVPATGSDVTNGAGQVSKVYPSAMTSTSVQYWWQVYGTKTGFGPATPARSNAVRCDRPAAGGPV